MITFLTLCEFQARDLHRTVPFAFSCRFFVRSSDFASSFICSSFKKVSRTSFKALFFFTTHNHSRKMVAKFHITFFCTGLTQFLYLHQETITLILSPKTSIFLLLLILYFAMFVNILSMLPTKLFIKWLSAVISHCMWIPS